MEFQTLGVMSIVGKYIFVVLLLVLPSFIGEIYGQEFFRVMFYNTENFYDTIPNPAVNDISFTPSGELHWNSFRYLKKVEDVSKVISSVGGKYPPAIVGLCEVENKTVLDDLVKNSSLSRHKYKYTMTNSKDARGSNVALLYQRDQFKYISKKTYRPKLDGMTNTRDILHVSGMLVSGDTLDIFVCHFPSRTQGVRKTEENRCKVADLLRKNIDKLEAKRVTPRIIVMGDFNDYPDDRSMKTHLKAERFPLAGRKINDLVLYNLFENKYSDTIQSYKYNGKWGYLDQFLVTGTLLNDNSTCYVHPKEAFVFSPDFLLTYDEKYGGYKPHRTYSGWTYLGGISDHLPIYFDLTISE